MNWLVKEEPSHYAFDTLARDGKAVWRSVRNSLAQRHLRGIKKGDRIFYYHTGSHKAVVGIAKALSDPCPDPKTRPGNRRPPTSDRSSGSRVPSRSPRSRRIEHSGTFRWSASRGSR